MKGRFAFLLALKSVVKVCLDGLKKLTGQKLDR